MIPSEILAICVGGAAVLFVLAFNAAMRCPAIDVEDDYRDHDGRCSSDDIFADDPSLKAPYPHCDSDVLHAPGECEYCDEYPEAQHERIDNDINFTGHHHADKATCPSEMARPLETIERWPGNRAEHYRIRITY